MLFYALVRSNTALFQIRPPVYNENGHNAWIILDTRALPGNQQLLPNTKHFPPGKASFDLFLIVLCIS